MNSYRFIISGGGTGGHIFPAIAIANALKATCPDAQILFVGAKGKMEMQKVPAAGYAIEGLWISGLQRHEWQKNLLFPFKILSSVVQSFRILNRFKPHAVIGVGGYASGAILYAAQMAGISTFIQEQNSFPGLTNKLLAKKIRAAFVAYEGLEKYFGKEKTFLYGNPIREQLFAHNASKKGEALAFFNFQDHKKTLFVFGGSLGAKAINEAILANLEVFIANDVQVIWQTGEIFFDTARAKIEALGSKNIRAMPFLERMDLAYCLAQVVVSRAGAGTISELATVCKPAIFVPLPTAAEDHQTKNAMALVSKNAALMIENREASTKLLPLAMSLLQNVELQMTLKANIAHFDRHHAASQMAQHITQILENK